MHRNKLQKHLAKTPGQYYCQMLKYVLPPPDPPSLSQGLKAQIHPHTPRVDGYISETNRELLRDYNSNIAHWAWAALLHRRHII